MEVLPMISSQSDRMRWYLLWVFVGLFIVVSVLTILSLFFGIGNLNERHEGKLVTAFVLEVGLAVAALFYSLFALKRLATSETPAEKKEPNVQENVAVVTSNDAPLNPTVKIALDKPVVLDANDPLVPML
jgi:thiol:disulfide interchange protein